MTEQWTLLTSHGLVLVYLASQPSATVRETADCLGFSERRVAAIIHDLEAAGMVHATRDGRRKQYTMDPNAQFRHPAMRHLKVREVLERLRIATEPAPVGGPR